MISYFIVAHCTFTANYPSNLSLNFWPVLVRIIFAWKWVHFWSAICITLQTVPSLMDGGMHTFIITHFLQKGFPCLLIITWFVVRYFSFDKQTVLIVFPDYSFVTTKSLIFFFICLQMVAFEYFQYDIIFDISE